MKKHVGLRMDESLKEILENARNLSGIPISEIVRQGALSKAFEIISMFKNKQVLPHVNTTKHTHCNSQERKVS